MASRIPVPVARATPPTSTNSPARSAPSSPESAGPRTASTSMLNSGPSGMRRVKALRTPRARRTASPMRRLASMVSSTRRRDGGSEVPVFVHLDVLVEVPPTLGQLLELVEEDRLPGAAQAGEKLAL